jgi:hypothetical protein
MRPALNPKLGLLLKRDHLRPTSLATASGLGVGANPTTWVVAVAFLAIVRFLIDCGKETNMKATNICRKAHVKSRVLRSVVAFSETLWAIATNVVAGFVTLSNHQKGAPSPG